MMSSVVSPAALACPVHTLDQLKLLLFLHARPCRSYTAEYLAQKLVIAPDQALTFLLAAGLVVGAAEPRATFSYGVEAPELLSAIDALSLRFSALSALVGFACALTRRRRRDTARRLRLASTVAKPRQLCGPRLLTSAEPAAPQRRRRGPRHSLASALRASSG